MSHLKTLHDINIAGKRLLVRADFDVPLNHGQVANDRRIVAALPTIHYALEHDASLVLMSHLGSPGGSANVAYSLRPVAEKLQAALAGSKVRLVDEWTDEGWTDEGNVNIKNMTQRGDEILLLENLRFHPGEENCDEAFCDTLARWGDAYVNDAFAACHRKHASTYGVAQRFAEEDRVMGLQTARELNELDSLLDSARRPFVVVLGGVKVKGKIGVINCLLERADTICVGGAMAYTFLKAASKHVGASKVKRELVGFAKQLVSQEGDSMILPTDFVIADEPHASAQIERADGGIPDGWYGMDIGPKTISTFCNVIHDAGTIIWNGPMGKFEDEPFRHGTASIVRAIAETDARTLVGGGETGQAVEQFGAADAIDHVSTGGGAFLTYLKDRELPALDVIPERTLELVSQCLTR